MSMITIDYDPVIELFSRIKKLRYGINFNILNDELNRWKTDNLYINYHLEIKSFDDCGIFIIYADDISSSLSHTDNLINDIISKSNLIIFDMETLSIVASFYNKSHYDNNALNILKNKDWNNVEITKYSLDAKRVCIFNNKSKWYICNSLNKSYEIKEIITDVINIENAQFKINLSLLCEEHVYHFLLKHKNFRKIGYNDDCLENISLLWICDKNSNLVADNKTNIPIEKIFYFSCLDELSISLEMMNNETIINKSLSFGGYYIKILSHDKKRYTLCALRTEIYKYVLSLIPTHENQYVNYLELYQNNKLSEILVYLHKYPTDVIRRINMSIKTLSKELLNIYHLTRKKQNSNLYECLMQSYKKVLYDLHKIYVNQKCEGFNIKSTDILVEKKSISVEIVYNYLKNISINELLHIFSDRSLLIDKLDTQNYEYRDILYIDNIDIITQIELMTS